MARVRKDMRYSGEKGYDKPKPDSWVLGVVGKADKIRQLSETLEAENDINFEAIDHFISLYKGTVDLGIPAGKRFVHFDARSGKAPDIIHRAMGMLMSPLRFQYIAPNRSTVSEEKAEAIQRHVVGAYAWMDMKYQNYVGMQALFWQLLAGKSYIQQTYLPNYWNKQVRRRKESEKLDGDEDPMQYDKNQMFNVRVDGYKGFMGPPFFVESLDPRTVIPIMTPMGPTAHVKRYKVQRYEVEEALAEAGQPIHIKTGDTGQIEDIIKLKPGQELPEEAPSTNDHQVTYYELIDDEWCYYVCEDRVIHAYRHKGGIRIVHGYGLITGFKEFEMMAVGILYPVRHEIPQFDFLRTLWANRAYIDVFPQLFAELEAGMEPLRDSDKNPEQWEIEPMTIKQIRGKITNAFKDAQAGVDYRALVEEMAVDIDMATIPGIARGVGGAQQPGYAINQLSQSMRTVWKPLIDSRTLQWSTLAHHYLWSLKHLVKEETTVFTEKTDAKGFKTGEYLSLEPEDLQDFFQIVADLQPDLPIDAQGNMMTWMKAGGDGWATWEEVSREGFNRPDWKTRRDQTERDSARKAMFPDAMQDAIMIGKIRLQQQIAEESGMTDLNAPFQQSLESMRATAGQTPGPGTGAGQGGPEGTNGAPAGANGAVKGAQNGIAPTTGANPATAAPGPRR